MSVNQATTKNRTNTVSCLLNLYIMLLANVHDLNVGDIMMSVAS